MRTTTDDAQRAVPLMMRIDDDAPATSKRNRDDITKHLAATVSNLEHLRDTVTNLLNVLESGEEGLMWGALTRLGGGDYWMSTADLVGYAVKAQTAAARTVAVLEAALFAEDAR